MSDIPHTPEADDGPDTEEHPALEVDDPAQEWPAPQPDPDTQPAEPWAVGDDDPPDDPDDDPDD